MDSIEWDGCIRRQSSPRLEKKRDEGRRRRSTNDEFDRIASCRAERRRVSTAVRLLFAQGRGGAPFEEIEERVDNQIACARQQRRPRAWRELLTRRQRAALQDRFRVMSVGMRWFYRRERARSRSPERFDDESLARHAATLLRTPCRFALPLALRWERWLSSDLEFPSERLGFFFGVISCNEVVARMLAPRPELRAALEAWILRTRAAASSEELREAAWVFDLQGTW